MPAGAAAGVEHALPSEERAVDGIEPVEELLLELGMELGEVLPLPAERRRGLPLLLDEVGRDEPRDAVPNRPVATAAVADEPAGLDLDRRSARSSRSASPDSGQTRSSTRLAFMRASAAPSAPGRLPSCRGRSSDPAPVPELEDEQRPQLLAVIARARRGARTRAARPRAGSKMPWRLSRAGDSSSCRALAQLALEPRRDRDPEALLRRGRRCPAADVRAIARLSRCFVSKRRSLRRGGTRPRNSTSSTSRNGARTSSEHAMLARSTFTRMSSCR